MYVFRICDDIVGIMYSLSDKVIGAFGVTIHLPIVYNISHRFIDVYSTRNTVYIYRLSGSMW